MIKRNQGIRQITHGLGTLDRELFEAISDTPTPLLDYAMPRLTRAADHSKLWIAIAAGLYASGRPSLQRGAARGLVTLAVTSAFTNQVAKRVRHRPRPHPESIPLIRRVHRRPTSNSMPSGHSASAAAFAVGVGLENPLAGAGLGVLAGLVGLSRVATGAHYPGDVVAGFIIGVGIASLGGRLVPPIPEVALPKAESLHVPVPTRPRGAGLVVVINPASGGGTGARIADELRGALPEAEVVELQPGDDIGTVLRESASRAEVLGVGGGDGTVATAAGVAVDAGLPLAVFPAGTFNHFARDLGCETVAKTVEAIRAGTVTRIDLVRLNDDHVVINTASIGAYPAFVRHREMLEKRIGKPLAAVVALQRTLRKERGVRIRFDNRTLSTSLMFLGNSVYLPTGFAPALRTRIDDGLLDVRILETGGTLAGIRLAFALATGRLQRCPLYHELQVPEFEFTAIDGPTPIAHDGELGEPCGRARFVAHYRALAVYRPAASTSSRRR